MDGSAWGSRPSAVSDMVPGIWRVAAQIVLVAIAGAALVAAISLTAALLGFSPPGDAQGWGQLVAS